MIEVGHVTVTASTPAGDGRGGTGHRDGHPSETLSDDPAGGWPLGAGPEGTADSTGVRGKPRICGTWEAWDACSLVQSFHRRAGHNILCGGAMRARTLLAKFSRPIKHTLLG